MIKKSIFGSAATLAIVALFASTASAATTTVVTPTNQQGWTTADTRPGGAVNYVNDPTSPYPNGALQLTTSTSTAAKAQYMHQATTTLSDITELSYWTKYVAGPDYAAPSYQLAVDLNGTAPGGFTTLVYEPYQNGTVATTTGTSTTSTTWQQWDVDAGQFWSSRSFTDTTASSTCMVTAGGGGAPFYTLAGLQAACPDATVSAFGVNVGSNNPGYDVYTDGINFNGDVYDFELYQVAQTADACRNGGFRNLRDANGQSFRNQGDCVSFVNTQGRNQANPR